VGTAGRASWLQALEAAGNDRRSGAAAIAARAADAFARLAADAPAESRDALVTAILDGAQLLLAGQPAMAPLYHLANRVAWAAAGADTLAATRAAAHAAAERFAAEQHEQLARVAALGASLIGAGATVLTHSFSAAVLLALREAHSAGRAPRVICTESRPQCEGRALARELLSAGLAPTLVLDAAAFGELPEAALVLLGADSLAPGGIVNKTGSAGLAWAAAARRVPVYVLAGSVKIWPAELGEIPILPQREPDEIWPDAPAGLHMINRYFDVTPWTAIAGVVTEQGVLGAEAVLRQAGELHIQPALLARLARRPW
jgi:translation initiation factor 2B subunit (eIF-2B alpha/beta/delta family)